MALFEWTEELKTGIQSIDNQHKQLVDLINELHKAMLERRSKDVLGGVFNELIDYTNYHFKHEEELFNQHNYSQSVNHVSEHKKFVKQVVEMKTTFESEKIPITVEVLDFLQTWLKTHILGSDKKYVPYLQEKGVK